MKYLARIINSIILGLILTSPAFGQATPIPTPVDPPLIIPMLPGRWQQHYNTPTGIAFGTAAPLRINPNGGLTEVFPDNASMRFNYLITPLNGVNITKYHYLSMTVGVTTVSGNPVFEFLSPTNQCRIGCNPVSARLLIFGPNGDLTSTANRWWDQTTGFWPLAPGKATITVPLDGANWSGVLGQNGGAGGKAQFLASKVHVYALGLTFGGGWYMGHGTNTGCAAGSTAPCKYSFQIYNYMLY